MYSSIREGIVWGSTRGREADAPEQSAASGCTFGRGVKHRSLWLMFSLPALPSLRLDDKQGIRLGANVSSSEVAKLS